MLNRYTLPLISALVVSASLASCQRKEVASVPELPPAGEIGFTVSDSDAETKSTPLKTADFGTNHNPFKVVVYSHAEGAATNDWELLSDAQICTYEESSGIWRPNTPIKWPMTEEKLAFIACAPTSLSPTTSSDGPLADGEAPFLKDYTVDSDVAKQVDILLASKESSASPLVQDVSVGLTFRHALTFVKFSIGAGITCTSITLSGIQGTGTLNMRTGEWSFLGTDNASYTISDPAFGDPDDNRQCLIDEELTLMLIPQTLPLDAKLTAVTSAGTITASLAGQVWEPGKVFTYKIGTPVFSFTVSSTGDKVIFSPGNLQAVFDDVGTSFTWKFADHQWDYVGGRTQSGSETETGNNFINGNGSVYAAGTVDLFGWSTDDTVCGIHNSQDDSEYGGSFADWGSDSRLISTLGSGWRTLSKDEWVWLLGPNSSPKPGKNCRTSSRVNGDSNARYCKATVNSVRGLVIFPDVYFQPSDVTPPTSVNSSSAEFTSNSWSDTDWTKMEFFGCVFLPAAGTRIGTSITDVGNGDYWSSTLWYSTVSYEVGFNNVSVNAEFFQERSYGYSVRLVQDL